MAEHSDVPEKRCSRGHKIPLNGDVVGEERDQFGQWHPIVLKTSHLICRECALEASGGEIIDGVRHRPRQGQETGEAGAGELPANGAHYFREMMWTGAACCAEL